MLKISCRLSHFLTKLFFCTKFFARQVSNISCRIIHTVQYFSNNHYFVFIVNAKNRTSLTMLFGYGKLKTKINEKGITLQRKTGGISKNPGSIIRNR